MDSIAWFVRTSCYTKSVFFVLYVILQAQVSTGQCDGHHLLLQVDHMTKFTVETPGYPTGYNTSLTCTWTVDVSNRSDVLLIQVVNTDVSCGGDGVTITEETSGTKQIDLFCGYGGKSTRVVSFLSGQATITFVSNSIADSRDKGLQVFMLSVPNKVAGTCQPAATVQSTEDEQFLYSTRFPEEYPEVMSCQWTIQLMPGYNMELIIYFEDLEHDSAACGYDYMVIKSASKMIRKSCEEWDFSKAAVKLIQINETTVVTIKSDDSTGNRGVMLGYRAVKIGLNTSTANILDATIFSTKTEEQTPTTLQASIITSSVQTTPHVSTTTTNAPTTTGVSTTTTNAPTTTGVSTTTTNAPTTGRVSTTTTNAPTTGSVSTTTTNAPTTGSVSTTTTNAPTTSRVSTTTTNAPTTGRVSTTTTHAPTTTGVSTTTTNAPTTGRVSTTTTNAPTTGRVSITMTNAPTTGSVSKTTNAPTTTRVLTTTTNAPTTGRVSTTTTNAPTTTRVSTTTTNEPTTGRVSTTTTNALTTTRVSSIMSNVATTPRVSTTTDKEIVTEVDNEMLHLFSRSYKSTQKCAVLSCVVPIVVVLVLLCMFSCVVLVTSYVKHKNKAQIYDIKKTIII